MIEIIPAIIAKDFGELKNKVKIVEPHVKTVQLDIMDGVFVNNVTWPFTDVRDKSWIKELEDLDTKLVFEAHLMVADPETEAKIWTASPVRKIIIHWEALNDFKTQVNSLLQIIGEGNKKFGIALNPDTPIEVLDHFINIIDIVLLMSVNPGFGGQEFIDDVIHKVYALRHKHRGVKIEVDGGINFENAEQLIEAGADFLAVGSAIFESKNIGETIKKLSQIPMGN